VTAIPAECSAVPSPTTCAPIWSKTPYAKPSPCAATYPARSSSTPIEAVNTPASKSLTWPANSTCFAQWAVPGCAGTTRLPNRSGQHSRTSTTTGTCSLFPTIDAARRGAYTWIDAWYNARRRHSAIGYLSPLQYEHQLADQATQTVHQAA